METLKLTNLNEPGNDTFLELQLISQGKFDEVISLVKAGYRLSPDVLTAIAVLGGPTGSNYIYRALHAVHEGRYTHLTSWLQEYYGEEWKKYVAEYKLIAIAREELTSEECAQAELWDALKCTYKANAMETLAKHKGIQYIKDYFEQLCKKASNLESVQEEIDRVAECLLAHRQHEILAQYGRWKILSQTQSGCSYVALQASLKQNYQMLFSFLSWNRNEESWNDCRDYCLGVLQRAFSSLSKEQQKELKKYLKNKKS